MEDVIGGMLSGAASVCDTIGSYATRDAGVGYHADVRGFSDGYSYNPAAMDTANNISLIADAVTSRRRRGKGMGISTMSFPNNPWKMRVFIAVMITAFVALARWAMGKELFYDFFIPVVAVSMLGLGVLIKFLLWVSRG